MFHKRQYKKIQIHETGFTYKGQSHSFEEIEHIFFERTITTQRMNFVKVGEPESGRLILTLEAGQKIKLSFDETPTFIGINIVGLNTNKQADLKNLLDLYIFLSEKTFQKRIAPYVTQVENQGYFVFDNCRFYPKNKIVFKDQTFHLSETVFRRHPGYIELRKKNSGVLDKIKRNVLSLPSIKTRTDADVIFALLDHYFDIRWKS